MHSSRHQNLTDLCEVELCEKTPSFVHAHRAQGRKGMGLRYERKVHEAFHKKFSHLYLPSLWFAYRRRSSPSVVNYAQPDGVLLDFHTGVCTIIEVKYNHTSDAFFQLSDKYLPLLDKWLHNRDKGLWSFVLCEVVYWYDKGVEFPCRVSLRDCVTKVRPGEFGVHIWRP